MTTLPQLTSEQKLAVRNSQLSLLGIREKIRELNKEAEKEQKAIQTVIELAAASVDSKVPLEFDLETLVYKFPPVTSVTQGETAQAPAPTTPETNTAQPV